VITLKSAPNKQRHAVYSGECRIGYIDQRANGEHVWFMPLVSPKGGAYMGVAADLANAQTEMAVAFAGWCEAAGLKDAEQ
jgi:hypothetical protein